MSTKQLEKKEEKVEKRPSANSGAGSFSMPPVTIFENDDCVTVQADLPGVSKERVSLHCEQDTLTLEGELFELLASVVHFSSATSWTPRTSKPKWPTAY